MTPESPRYTDKVVPEEIIFKFPRRQLQLSKNPNLGKERLLCRDLGRDSVG